MRVSTATLLAVPLPGPLTLAVENIAAGYALPPLSGGVAVFGGGANVKWTQARWLQQRRFAYWGDIDTWALHHIAEVRRSHPHVQPLLMDEATLIEHQSRLVDVKEPNPVLPSGLTDSETRLYRDLVDRRYGGTCLEQERISADRLYAALARWASENSEYCGTVDRAS
jgi:hypothetical protein